MRNIVLKAGVSSLLLLVAVLWVGGAVLTQARQQALAPAVAFIMATPAINTPEELDAACAIATRVAQIPSVCYMGDYPVVYRGHRLNFSEIRIDGGARKLNGQGSTTVRAIIALDSSRKAYLVRYETPS